jgi:NhaP-type Na+/H+ or K+/H+ antiporter
VTELIVFGLVLVGYGLVSGRLDGTPITAPMVFVAAGIAAGATDAFGIRVEGSHVLVPETPKHVAEFALVLLLFTGAARIDIRALRSASNLPLRLLAIGLPLSILLGGLIALALFSGTLDFWEAFLVAAILAPTDAALGAVIVSSPKLSLRLRQTIDVEAGLNDGLAVPFFTVFAALAVSEADHVSFLTVALEKLGYGILIGVGFGAAGGWLMRVFSARGWMTGVFRQLGVMSVALLAWWCAEELGGSGLIAAFVAGLAFGVAARAIADESIELADDVGQLLSLLVFFTLGLVALDAFGLATWEIGAFAVLALTVIRMLPVTLALVGTGLDRGTVAYVGWFGPRGLASILLALMLVIQEPDLPGIGTIFVTVVVTVVVSVFLHGATAAPLTDRLARRSTL